MFECDYAYVCVIKEYVD